MIRDKKLISVLGLGVLFLFIYNSKVFAQPVNITIPKGNENTKRVQLKLDEAKLRACQTKRQAIYKRMEKLTQLSDKIFDKFTKIAERVKEYYNSKVVTAGKRVSNYDRLVSDIESKKAVVQTKLSLAKSDVESFSCEGDNPKGVLQNFRNRMREVKKALKDYRTSIKNLIVAVHSVTGATQIRQITPEPTYSYRN